jgi:hypothetical protein
MNVPPMVFDDAVADRQPQPGSLTGWLGCVKWIEDTGDVSLFNTATIIDDLNEDPLGAVIPNRLHLNGALFFDGVRGIHHQVDEHLFDFLFIQKKFTDPAVIGFSKSISPFLAVLLDEVDDIVNNDVDIAQGFFRG